MNLLSIWDAMEGDIPRDQDGRLVRRVAPEASVDVFAVLELRAGDRQTTRAIELWIDPKSVREIDAPPSTKMVDAAIEPRGVERSALVLSLEDGRAREIFAAMCADVIGAATAAASDRDAVAAWLGRFAKWRRMLQGGMQGLGAERQRGLFGELSVIRETFIPSVGFDESIRAWLGADGAPRDFELRGHGVEVKTCAANEPQVVKINGERQLDCAGLRTLTLVHLSLEVVRDSGESLPEVVASLRRLGTECAEAGLLEDRLLQSGYIDEHANLYRRTGYLVRRRRHFEVADGFPRIVEADLPDGIGDVRYRLVIDALREFETPSDQLTDLLGAA